MAAEKGPTRIDWDGLWTFLLTLLIICIGLGLPLVLAYGHALQIARRTACNDPASTALVFGKRLDEGAIDTEYRSRLDKAMQLVEAGRVDSLLLLGGSPDAEAMSEAAAGLRYLEARGVAGLNRVHLEEKSANTLENLRNAREMLAGDKIESVTLISNRYHLARCSLIARSLCLRHSLCPAEEDCPITRQLLGRLLAEAFYILWFSTGKSWARLTGNQRMLGRVT